MRLINWYLKRKAAQKKRKCPHRMRCLTHPEDNWMCMCNKSLKITLTEVMPVFKYNRPLPETARLLGLTVLKQIARFFFHLNGGSYANFGNHHIKHCQRSVYIFNICVLHIKYDTVEWEH